MKKRLLAMAGVAACLVLPASALAGEPSDKDKTNAAKECKAERGTTDASREAFALKYGTNKNRKNAFGKCVSSRAKDEAAERKAAKSGAVRDCREERDELGVDDFRDKYGTNKNGKNAFGKCVSQHRKQREKKADRADKRRFEKQHNAAQECASEREAMGRADFNHKYGTENSNRQNAFGKCVSTNARS